MPSWGMPIRGECLDGNDFSGAIIQGRQGSCLAGSGRGVAGSVTVGCDGRKRHRKQTDQSRWATLVRLLWFFPAY